MHRIRLRSHGDPVICKLPKAHSQGTKKTKREIAVQQTFSLKGTRCSGAFTCRLSFSYQASELDKSTKIMSTTSTSSKLVRSNIFTILSYYTLQPELRVKSPVFILMFTIYKAKNIENPHGSCAILKMKRCDFFQLPDRKLMEILPASGTSHKTGLINVKKRKLPLKMWANHVALVTFSRWILENKRSEVWSISICFKDIHIRKKK